MKPIILVVAETYLPGHCAGGPVRSLVNLVEHLGTDYQWKIVTADRDFRARTPYAEIEPGRWLRVGNAEVFYAAPGDLTPGTLIRLLNRTPHDVLYLNSFFSPRFSITPIFARCLGALPRRPTLIAPRGEFSPGAFHLKRWKKRPFARLARASGAYAHAHWHASTDLELDDIVRVMGVRPCCVHVARNLGATSIETIEPRGRQPTAALRVCFLSRIARKKNLDYALRVLGNVRLPVEFTIYGPKEDQQYWSQCDALIHMLPSHVSATFRGPIPNERVRQELATHDLFLLPTRGENFGHALVEAWSAGLPVLTSDQTPWRGLAGRGVGWDLPLCKPGEFSQVIDTVAGWPAERLRAVKELCIRFAEEIVGDQSAALANRQMLKSLTAPAVSDPQPKA